MQAYLLVAYHACIAAHTSIPARILAFMYTCIHTCVHTYTHVYIQAYTRKCICVYLAESCMNTLAQKYLHFFRNASVNISPGMPDLPVKVGLLVLIGTLRGVGGRGVGDYTSLK